MLKLVTICLSAAFVTFASLALAPAPLAPTQHEVLFEETEVPEKSFSI